MSESQALPSGWAQVSLSDIVELSPKSFQTLPAASAMPVHFVPMCAVTEEFGGIDVSARRPLAEVQKGYTSFLERDVLFAKITPCMENGKLAVVPPLADQIAYGSTEFHVLRPESGIRPDWLAHYLSQSNFRRRARQNMTGSAGQLRVSTTWLADARIPVAPTPEQATIVAKLEELLSDLDTGVAELKAAQRKLQQYRQSVLRAAVEGTLTTDWRARNPSSETGADLLTRILKEHRARWETRQLAKFRSQIKSAPRGWQSTYPEPVLPDCSKLPNLPTGWAWASLDQLAEFITSGSRGWADYYATAGATFIRSQNINKDRLDLTDIAFVNPPRNAEGARTRVQRDDLLLTITGANVGKCAPVDVELDEAYVSQHVALIRPVDVLLSGYLHLFLTAKAGGRGQLDKAAYGAGKPGLNLQQVAAVAVPLPSSYEVSALMDVVATQLLATSELEDTILRATRQSSAQRQNILRAAFAGQLVPQDPNDEPVSTLLARIRAERAAESAGRSPRSAGRLPSKRRGKPPSRSKQSS